MGRSIPLTGALAERFRKTAQIKAAGVLLVLLETRQAARHWAKYILFDTWFAMSQTILWIRENCGLDTIAMIRKSSRIKYQFEERRLYIKEIFFF